ncbi:MAG: hypothetical protein JHD02_03600 [Thermoleophilaceae bacterium]|nr:hypothetical protein [Thermoleophilaceae bacterium]
MTDEYIRDPESKKRIEERTKLSTTAMYSNLPAAKLLEADEYEREEKLECPFCGWSGRVKDGEVDTFAEVFDVSCPECGEMLLVVGYGDKPS